jgi:hypothetical protein
MTVSGNARGGSHHNEEGQCPASCVAPTGGALHTKRARREDCPGIGPPLETLEPLAGEETLEPLAGAETLEPLAGARGARGAGGLWPAQTAHPLSGQAVKFDHQEVLGGPRALR